MKIEMMRFYTRKNKQDCIETVCIVKFRGDLDSGTLMGNAIQNPMDRHNEYIGRKVALTRLMKEIQFKTTRELIWQHFHKHFPKPEVSDNVTATVQDEPEPIAKCEPTDYVFGNLDEKYRKVVEYISKQGICINISCKNCPFRGCYDKYRNGQSGENRVVMLRVATSYLNQLNAIRDAKTDNEKIDADMEKYHVPIEEKYREVIEKVKEADYCPSGFCCNCPLGHNLSGYCLGTSPRFSHKYNATRYLELLDAKKDRVVGVDGGQISPSQIEQIMKVMNLPQDDIDRYKKNGLIL